MTGKTTGYARDVQNPPCEYKQLEVSTSPSPLPRHTCYLRQVATPLPEEESLLTHLPRRTPTAWCLSTVPRQVRPPPAAPSSSTVYDDDAHATDITAP